LLDGSETSEKQLKNMLFYDVNNGISRRSWARNEGAIFAIKREMKRTPHLKVTVPYLVADEILENLFKSKG
jgi:urocanate hydratase